MVDDMTRGGRRDGAGRPQSEPTKQVRIPISMADVARELVDIYKARLVDRLHEETWFRTAPEREKCLIHLENIRLEMLTASNFFYGNLNEETQLEALKMDGALCMIADAKHPSGESITVWVKI